MRIARNKSLFILVFSLFCSCSLSINADNSKLLSEGDSTVIAQDRPECINQENGLQTCAPQPPIMGVKDLVCSAEGMGTATFKLCNLEALPVTALSIDMSSQNFIEQQNPSLPLTIEADMCVEITVAGIERQDIVNPESKFSLQMFASRKPGFDCSGDYGFGYVFGSDSDNPEMEPEDFEGISGFVSLYNPIESEPENER